MDITLNKRGSYLHIRDGCYHIKTPDETLVVPVEEVRSITLHKASSVSYEAIATALKNNTDIIFVGRDGFPIGRIWDSRYGTLATVRKNQPLYAQSVQGRLCIVSWIRRKMQNQIIILETLTLLESAHHRQLASAIELIQRLIIQSHQADTEADWKPRLRGIEGKSSMQYFAAVSMMLPEAYTFDTRSQHPAKDMFNALLNYAYGMLYKEVESVLIRTGFDPAIGIFHANEYNKPVLVYDFIEPFRYWADYVVINLCLQQVLYPEFFEFSQGACWCGDGAKRILIQAMTDYLDEVVEEGGRTRSRRHHLFLEAQQLAQVLKNFDSHSNQSLPDPLVEEEDINPF